MSYDESFTTSGICGFPTRFEWVGTGYGTIFTDAAGNFVSQRDRIRETLTVTNTHTGVWLSGWDAYQISVDAQYTFVRVGLWFHLTSPGYGVLLHDVGRAVFSDGELVSRGGAHDWLDGNFEALCSALGG